MAIVAADTPLECEADGLWRIAFDPESKYTSDKSVLNDPYTSRNTHSDG